MFGKSSDLISGLELWYDEGVYNVEVPKGGIYGYYTKYFRNFNDAYIYFLTIENAYLRANHNDLRKK